MEQVYDDDFEKSALIIPVTNLISSIQEIRKKYTIDGAANLVPHVTVLFPFFESRTHYVQNEEKISELCTQFNAFNFSLGSIDTFDNEGVLHLLPNKVKPFRNMLEKLVNEFPEMIPYRGTIPIEEITAHLTIAVETNPIKLRKIHDKLLPTMDFILPHEVNVQELWMVVKKNNQWYKFKEFPLCRR